MKMQQFHESEKKCGLPWTNYQLQMAFPRFRYLYSWLQVLLKLHQKDVLCRNFFKETWWRMLPVFSKWECFFKNKVDLSITSSFQCSLRTNHLSITNKEQHWSHPVNELKAPRQEAQVVHVMWHWHYLDLHSTVVCVLLFLSWQFGPTQILLREVNTLYLTLK